MRFINNNYSSSLSKLLSQTKTEPVHVKRLKLMVCEVFKIVNKLSPEYIQDLINIKTSPYNFRGERKADLPRMNTTRYGLRSFRSKAPRIWNSLPNNLRVAESYPQFRRLLQRAGMTLDRDALCVVLSFIFYFCFTLLLCLVFCFCV